MKTDFQWLLHTKIIEEEQKPDDYKVIFVLVRLCAELGHLNDSRHIQIFGATVCIYRAQHLITTKLNIRWAFQLSYTYVQVYSISAWGRKKQHTMRLVEIVNCVHPDVKYTLFYISSPIE